MICKDSLEVVVVGLGYVGLTLGVHIANKGFTVHGVERAAPVLKSLEKKKAHFFENDFDPLVKKVIENGKFTFGNYVEKSTKQRVYIITVGTPLGSTGTVNMDSLSSVTEMISKVISEGDAVVLRSTVTVGTTEGFIKPILDKICSNYYLAFCPERTIEGKAVYELEFLPQVIGAKDTESLNFVSEFFSHLCEETVLVDSCQEAEMTKLINNTERDVMFAFANEVALLCEGKQINVNNVIKACNHNYPRSDLKLPGLVGGPCLEKDPYILAEGFKEIEIRPQIALKSRKLNEELVTAPIQKCLQKIGENRVQVISVLGLAFKGMPATSDLRGSLAIPMIKYINSVLPNSIIRVFDSLVTDSDLDMENLPIQRVKTINEAFEGADLVIVQNNSDDFKRMDVTSLCESMSSNGLVYDYWNLHPKSQYGNGVKYTCLGNV
ncbi:nucleotide sugar dehydrogenase [Thalassotalea montiporae]